MDQGSKSIIYLTTFEGKPNTSPKKYETIIILIVIFWGAEHFREILMDKC